MAAAAAAAEASATSLAKKGPRTVAAVVTAESFAAAVVAAAETEASRVAMSWQWLMASKARKPLVSTENLPESCTSIVDSTVHFHNSALQSPNIVFHPVSGAAQSSGTYTEKDRPARPWRQRAEKLRCTNSGQKSHTSRGQKSHTIKPNNEPVERRKVVFSKHVLFLC